MTHQIEGMINNNSIFSREDILQILNAALQVQSFRFARQTALNWLAVYSGDLEVNLILAKSLLGEGKYQPAVEILEHIIKLDPEYMDAYETLAIAAYNKDDDLFNNAKACANALGKEIRFGRKTQLPIWSVKLAEIRKLINAKMYQEAEALMAQIIADNFETPLVGVMHLLIAQQMDDEKGVQNLARIYNERWPETLQFSLFTASLMMNESDENSAVRILHQCVSQDAVGQVANRIWGSENRYNPLWPTRLETKLSIQIPASVASVLGLNKLPPSADYDGVENEVDSKMLGSNSDLLNEENPVERDLPAHLQREDREVDETLKPVLNEFDKLARKLNKGTISDADGRFPVYVIFSTKSGLEKKYGKQTANLLEKEMRRLAETIRKRPDWGAMVFCPDDLNSADLIGIDPLNAVDPWSLKLALVDLDKFLSKRGEMIGALLIVGGPDVVPFHKLPNPTDDVDQDVLSDNPYATLDSNYFIPEWPLGRLPGEAGVDAGPLLAQLRQIINYHSRPANTMVSSTAVNWVDRILEWCMAFIQKLSPKTPDDNGRKTTPKLSKSFGYTAAIWQRSSVSVYRSIGENRGMLISPPVKSGGFESSQLMNSSLGYFNLHGLSDTAEWYGQRDVNDQSDGPDYPVAITPDDLVKNGKAPEIVFSEACYGGYIDGKREAESLALKFLSVGTKSVVASTGISYGSISTPLIGADMMGKQFWKYVRSGYKTGEALLKAKYDLVQQMKARQGFLDGEDQKTLISFVLYGDPLAGSDLIKSRSKTAPRFKSVPEVAAIDDHDSEKATLDRISKEKLLSIKEAVEDFLPGLNDARISVSKTAVGKLISADNMDNAKSVKSSYNDQVKVTFSKTINFEKHVHHHYARVTLDDEGKMIKVAISR